MKKLQTEFYHIHRQERSSNHKVSRFVFLTDLHNCVYGRDNEELVNRIMQQQPDAILCTGDMIVGLEGETLDVSIALFEKLSAFCPVYYANGNHETRLHCYPERFGNEYEEYVGALTGCGVHMLNNETVLLPDMSIALTGLEMDACYYKRFRLLPMETDYLEQTLGQASEDFFQILLAHNPFYFPDYAKWGADLTLAGHVHGGIVRLPFLGGIISPQVSLFPKYSAGLYKRGEKQMIVSRGLGMHSIQLRVGNPPELSVIEID
ncbi:MAG: metallophosphoesterase [Lachnospiraceae bacterium]